jgi:peroxisomal 3,2-trans-enoyl-CoA isomerase
LKDIGGGDLEKTLENGCQTVLNFVNEFIRFEKPLVALVNGPSVGIAFTILGLFDYVVASDKATFSAPFTKLSLSPEGCSSYTFPRLMGHIKAAEVLLLNRKLTAQEAYDRNLVAQVIPHEQFITKTHQILDDLAKIPIKVNKKNIKIFRFMSCQYLI